MNSTLSDVKRDSKPCKTQNEISELIEQITNTCSFILQTTDSLPRKVDAVAVLFDNIAAEVFVSLMNQNQTN